MAVLISREDNDDSMDSTVEKGLKNASLFIDRIKLSGIPACDHGLVRQNARLRLYRGAYRPGWIRERLCSSDIEEHGKAARQCLRYAKADYDRERREPIAEPGVMELLLLAEEEKTSKDREILRGQVELARAAFGKIPPLSQHVLHTAPDDRAEAFLLVSEAEPFPRETRVLHDRDQASGIPEQVEQWAPPGSPLPNATRSDAAHAQFMREAQRLLAEEPQI